MTEGGTVVESAELKSRSTYLKLGETYKIYAMNRLTSPSLSLPIYKLGDIRAHRN